MSPPAYKAIREKSKGAPIDTIFGRFGQTDGNVKTLVSYKRNHHLEGWRSWASLWLILEIGSILRCLEQQNATIIKSKNNTLENHLKTLNCSEIQENGV